MGSGLHIVTAYDSEFGLVGPFFSADQAFCWQSLLDHIRQHHGLDYNAEPTRTSIYAAIKMLTGQKNVVFAYKHQFHQGVVAVSHQTLRKQMGLNLPGAPTIH